jgi:cell division protein FtsB
MRRETESGGIIRMLGLKRVLAVNVAVFALVSWGLAGEYLRNREMQKEIDTLETRANGMQEKNADLADATERFGSQAVLEREARLKLNLQKPGEAVVVVRDAAPRPVAEAGGKSRNEGSGAAPGSNAAKWWHYFFP